MIGCLQYCIAVTPVCVVDSCSVDAVLLERFVEEVFLREVSSATRVFRTEFAFP